jgi:hypothetical protein
MRKATLFLTLIAFSGVLFASLAHGAEWELFLQTDNNSTFHYVDRESLEPYVYDNAMHAWIKKVLLKPRPYPRGADGKRLQMSLVHYELNCEVKKFRVTKAILIYEDGTREEAKVGEYGHRWKEIPPDENEEYYKYLCGKTGD